jgi:transcriptional regulator with PAS, ATPase and Fis domain
VLLLGATGTGREVAASALHALGGRRGPLVAVNCAAVPETFTDGMFFGVQRDAFTGAVLGVGLFGEANQGTLFLDDVGDLPAELQPKLLRTIERYEVFRSTAHARCRAMFTCSRREPRSSRRSRRAVSSAESSLRGWRGRGSACAPTRAA